MRGSTPEHTQGRTVTTMAYVTLEARYQVGLGSSSTLPVGSAAHAAAVRRMRRGWMQHSSSQRDQKYGANAANRSRLPTS